LLNAHKKNVNASVMWLIITFILGAVFIGMELYEFHTLWSEGNSWDKHGALSAFFTLVGTHGLHVAIGLGCLISLVAQLKIHGATKVTIRK
ncbi:cytochrome (ubi)quinol oxidase subunit III, partial [Mycobacterium kansasii]